MNCEPIVVDDCIRWFAAFTLIIGPTLCILAMMIIDLIEKIKRWMMR